MVAPFGWVFRDSRLALGEIGQCDRDASIVSALSIRVGIDANPYAFKIQIDSRRFHDIAQDFGISKVP
ncbi:hypothetical protein D7S86_12840 [Pararobbsia silviterrae]|uniref:Uncharacterized protein n=1 Tax=Pararobbsia silviterrae TaxID=1792498 RepID=A0A494XVF0_9BURK|nr:hypothetical protein D7S86_12840 [Pararobbsia silviterrae]